MDSLTPDYAPDYTPEYIIVISMWAKEANRLWEFYVERRIPAVFIEPSTGEVWGESVTEEGDRLDEWIRSLSPSKSDKEK